MKKDLGVQPYLFPLPVLIIGTYCEDDTPDAMNAAWGTLCGFNKIALFLTMSHKTVQNIKNKKAFTIGIADEKHLIASDYVGLVSANQDKNKLEKSGFTTYKSKNVNAPIINELPLTIECTLEEIDETKGCVTGKIVNIVVEDNVLTNEKVDLNKLNPLSYDPSSRCYYTMGNKVGIAFHDGAVLKK